MDLRTMVDDLVSRGVTVPFVKENLAFTMFHSDQEAARDLTSIHATKGSSPSEPGAGSNSKLIPEDYARNAGATAGSI